MHRLLALTLFVSILAACALQNVAQTEASPTGAPRSENGRFENLHGDLSHGSFAVRFGFMMRRFMTYFRDGMGAPEQVANDGRFLRQNAGQGVATVTWIGHATLLVQMGRVSFLTDPIWSNRPSPVPLLGPKRFTRPGLSIEDLPPIDFVLISHNHYDHLDLPSLRALAQRSADTRFWVPLGNAALLRNQGIQNVEELDWGQTRRAGDVVIHCLPSQHWSKRGLTDDNKSLWASWAVTSDARRLFFAGDTGYFSGFKAIGRRLGPFDLAAVPIGAYEPAAMMRDVHLNPEQAIAAALDLRAQRALAIHFGTFDLSDEPLAEPPRRYTAAAKASGLQAAWVLDIGETRQF